ncbi:elongation factor P 5-aminopentanone reductase [Marinisporobacter balticus]|uniref:3-oxoacyl-[acyl-carrier protein] reductase n=1 Tax=Marinisporobacter balticus TaxID=2018667 RepID=A0A4R2KCN5_9FIRM|nr:3-oxoacyl-ACP reductase FabG [Marinisporobacter balticus]TCO70674.1 3-oxoacyl-[acyl-carrier protein] reductase [Marinisporobacter balticus]
MDYTKTVVITGASKGIGKATAIAFAQEGYHVLINFNKSEKDAVALYDNLKEKKCSVQRFKADVSKRKEVDNMISFCISQFGSIDILINNAGICQEKLFTDITDDDWDQMINTNLKSAFFCTQAALKYMLPQKKGKIINISSIWGMVGGSCEVHYSAAKAGLIGLTKALAKELGPSNIQVNCIAPGIIQTDMLSSHHQEQLNILRENTPLMKLGSPDDIARCAFFLASHHADFITGQIISPNGGFVI